MRADLRAHDRRSGAVRRLLCKTLNRSAAVEVRPHSDPRTSPVISGGRGENPMKKWIKRIVVAVVLLVLLAAGSVLTLLYLKNRKPDWYPRSLPDAAAIEAAAHSMENKFADLHNWAVENPARERAKLSGREPV